jgi:hypothetical protein
LRLLKRHALTNGKVFPWEKNNSGRNKKLGENSGLECERAAAAAYITLQIQEIDKTCGTVSLSDHNAISGWR